MNYQELKTIEDMINTRGSKLWIQMNDNSKAAKKRALFVQQHGGFFILEGKYWKWKSPIEEKNGYWLKRVDTGEKVFFENMSEFAKTQGMTAVKICELLNGKRKTYKGWTAVELRPVQETQGSIPKQKKPKKQKIPIKMGAVFVDMTTKQIFNVPSIADFAKENKLDYANLRKVALGKAKSYKNLKLYNPIEKYTDFAEG
jgi:hypothetical protein